ncbi:MAG: FAD binding domain-containing protein [Candidatus Marinimicrobia bacterium]|nr:FAD binding domain-containing protein [Candidatus Neomarinimicrobiota bacterium]
MWSSIKNIQFPETLAEAGNLAAQKNAAIFSGGTYLAAQRDQSVLSLVDINKLVTKKIDYSHGKLYCGAGATLQDLIDFFSKDDKHHLAAAARWSCASKNIRNQRTIGGEIAQGRCNSEVVVGISALNAQLEMKERRIITGLNIDLATVNTIHLERFAVLPSAPAFVIVVGVKRGVKIRIVIGGQARQLTMRDISEKEFDDQLIDNLSISAVDNFDDDHLGTRTYKQAVIRTGLQRVKGVL